MSSTEFCRFFAVYLPFIVFICWEDVDGALFDASYDVKSTVGLTLTTTSTLSASQCAFFCSSHSDCAGFNFAKNDSGNRKRCELRDTSVSGASDTTADVNFNYYGRFIEVECAAGWLRHGMSCYQFFSTNTAWTTSKSNCEALGSHLMTIDTLDEQSFLENIYVIPYVRPNTYHSQIWLGGEYTSGVWRWIDTLTPVDPTWPSWGSRGPYSTTVGTCLAYSVNDYFYCLMYDYACGYARPYLCEYEL